MPLRFCEHTGCGRVANRDFGSCTICSLHFCTEHAQSNAHKCPSERANHETYYAACSAAERDQLAAQMAKIDVNALKAVASKLRGDVPCVIPALAPDIAEDDRQMRLSSQMGGQNCHVDIQFEDGVTWIARFRLDHPRLPPQPVQNHIFLSEVATLKYLEPLSLPTPKVYHHEPPSQNNAVGIPYILMEKLSGSTLDWNTATEAQRVKVLEQMVEFYLELERHPLDAAGSLFPSAGSMSNVQGYALPQVFWSSKDTLGPFNSYDSAIRAIICLHMDMLTQGEITALPSDNYLTMLWRLENVPKLLQPLDKHGKFYLKHQDDKGDHILVDNDHNITGIIDWEWCTTEPAPFAFSSPSMMWPVGDYYDGKNVLSKEETAFAEAFDKKGRPDMARIVRDGRKWQRFTFFLGALPSDSAELESLFRGLLDCFSESEAEPYLQWKAKALKKWEPDRGLQELMKKHL